MKSRRLGQTNLEVSELGFGCIPSSGIGKAKVSRLINRAVDAGINCFDTAQGYGDSEAKLGKALGRVKDGMVLVLVSLQ